MALWTLAASGVTVFKILANSAKNTRRPLYGALNGILVSDRAKALNFWAMAQRQICWAHLLRKFIAFGAGRPERGVRESCSTTPAWSSTTGTPTKQGKLDPRHVRDLARPGATAARSGLGGRRLGRYLGPVWVLR
jgi:Transposase IS66 family